MLIRIINFFLLNIKNVFGEISLNCLKE